MNLSGKFHTCIKLLYNHHCAINQYIIYSVLGEEKGMKTAQRVGRDSWVNDYEALQTRTLGTIVFNTGSHSAESCTMEKDHGEEFLTRKRKKNL